MYADDVENGLSLGRAAQGQLCGPPLKVLGLDKPLQLSLLSNTAPCGGCHLPQSQWAQNNIN